MHVARSFLLPVITRYTHADSISTNSKCLPTDRLPSLSRTPTVEISHAYAESGVRALLFSHRHAVCLRADRAQLRKDRA